MANNNPGTAETMAPAAKVAAKPAAPTYTVDEFAAAPKALDVSSPDIIRAAFKVAGKTEATLEEAKKIVSSFKKKGVK